MSKTCILTADQIERKLQRMAREILEVHAHESEIALVTTPERLPNAMAYAQIKAPVPAVFAVADRIDLEAAIRRNYGLTDRPLVA
jgi:hypothetical protein